jgi:DNA-binding MarR family transcriptional regulator
LLQKGYVSERRSDEDKRVISFELTSKGRKVANEPTPLEITLENLMADDQLRLQNVLTKTLQGVLEQNEGLEFGPCHKCIHHTVGPDGLRCSLLAVALTELEGDQICFEQESA